MFQHELIMKNTVSKYMLFIMGFLGISLLSTNCVPVKGYQKVYINDEEMILENRSIEVFESDFQSYREGAVGGNNGNTGSGCGCN